MSFVSGNADREEKIEKTKAKENQELQSKIENLKQTLQRNHRTIIVHQDEKKNMLMHIDALNFKLIECGLSISEQRSNF